MIGADFRWRGRKSRIRLVRQTEVTECGLAALAMIASHHGLELSLAALRQRFPPSPRGTTLRSLIEIADSLGFVSRAVKVPLEALPHVRTPAILHWEMNHFVVLERMARGRALVHNPDGRTAWQDLEQLSSSFTGVALELTPAADFERQVPADRLRLRQLWDRITGLRLMIVHVALLTLVLQLFVLAFPYYLQAAIDHVVPARDFELLVLLAAGFGLLTAFNVIAMLLRSWVLITAGAAFGFSAAANVSRHLFRLPLTWFERRRVGDILARFQAIAPIQQFMTQGAVAAVLDGMFAALTLLMMLIYSAYLTAITLAALVLYVTLRALMFRPQRESKQAAIAERAKEQSMLIDGLRGVQALRLLNAEGMRNAQWQAQLASAINAEARVARLTHAHAAANTGVFGLEIVATVWAAVSLVIAGAFTVGMVFAFLAYRAQFVARVVSLVDQLINLNMLKLHLEQISDIAFSPEDISFRERPRPVRTFSGHIELRGVRYRYGTGEPEVLTGVDLTVRPGEHIAITGPSGGGKSTLARIVLGLIEPDEGQVLLDGIPLERFGHRQYRARVGAVLQDDHLFAGSLADNIALFEDEPDRKRIERAAARAAIHADVMAMPMGYETLVGDMGSTLSGGQRQRILLARALYRDPAMLVLDESTSQLDVENEAAVTSAIASMNLTRIVLAHRQETLRAADRVLSLEGGQLVVRDAGEAC